MSLRSLDGEIFPCAVLLVDRETQKSYIKDKQMLAVTRNQLIELCPTAYQIGSATVCEVHELAALAKLKFRRPVKTEGILILEYKSGKVDKFLMANPVPCVDLIKQRMQELGLAGDVHKAATSLRSMATANAIMEQAMEIEGRFSVSPSLELAQEMLSLLRQEVEALEAAGDGTEVMHDAALQHIRRFLTRDDVVQVLEGRGTGGSEGVRQEVQEVQRIEDAVLGTDHSTNDEQSRSPPRSPSPLTLDPAMLFPSPSGEEGEERRLLLEALTSPSPLLMSPSKMALVSEEETFQILSNAVTYEAEDEEPDLLDVSVLSKAEAGQQDLSDYLSHLDEEFNNMVQSFGDRAHSPRSVSTDGQRISGSSFDFAMEELERELNS